ncbi:hypothetical protein HNQ91_003860 [Filimonas zeae]|uniref:DUF4175 domain-containing protein n=1 Tax=Filimonas zeae TaxID=1737353 RepID=A0A917J423_9BACT|nr:DUF4175 family protein [Filimonas zeae]MDR6340787.1 hypothetical protein [Filimonas zeae]GGH78453.1 hypothetical protein GCM10011379_46380 [Filimonas zeae]
MHNLTPAQQLYAWRRNWRRQALLYCGLLAAGSALVTGALLHTLLHASWWWVVPVAAAAMGVAMFLWPQWRITEKDILQYLNRQIPELEESSELLLLPPDSTSPLQQLQLLRITPVMQRLKPVPPMQRVLKRGLLFFTGSALLCLLITQTAGKRHSDKADTPATSGPVVAEQLPPGIAGATVHIQPPAYTGKAARQQQWLNLRVEEGVAVNWRIRTTQPVETLQILFNDSTRLRFRATDSSHTQWQAGTTLTHSGFYRIQLAQQLSEFYKIESIKDQPPAISFQAPGPHTVIDYGMPEQVGIRLQVSDDYGVAGATIIATVASGSGEAVKFKEQQLAFTNSFAAHDTSYRLQQLLQLKTLQMQPGDELYFYVKATDTRGQQTRSDIYIVTLPDTAQLMSMDGIVSGVNLKPEYFRSQRQIIIETEQLLRDQATMSIQAFNEKSNDLGVDQKLLRLRYGRFLGEESETHIGEERVEDDEHGHDEHDHDEHDGHAHHQENTAKDFNNADKILDAFSHKHDIAEDATFFDPETKKQLKATLAEMWNAELRLRTFTPREALPYEYKALRLLKDLQQKSRSYVGKTSAKLPPLKPEKRLTGELDKIITPVYQKQQTDTANPYTTLRLAMSLLEQAQTGAVLSATDNALLQQVIPQLGKAAAAQPSLYLSAYEALQRITRLPQGGRAADIAVTLKALHRLTPAPGKLPSAPASGGMPALSQQYFQQLKAGKQL